MNIRNKSKRIFVKTSLILVGILLYSIGLKWFIYSANFLPSGLTGLSFLVQRIVYTTWGMMIPVTIYNVAFNLFPAIISFKVIGKKFTIISFIIMFLFSFVADYIPIVELTDDKLIQAIFGAILCGLGSSFWLRCGVSGGGTDFIAMPLAVKFHIRAFNYIMAFNILLILIQGFLYGWSSSFYSIIYQYVATQTLNITYKHFEARTIFVITTKPDAVSAKLIEKSGHSSTIFDGIGSYTKNKKSMLYTVVTQPEVRQMVHNIRECDPEAFVNIMESNEVQGNFTYLSVEQGEIDF
jgi:uncharacterized membrane-anchored protein YitT (DUF2179 family)